MATEPKNNNRPSVGTEFRAVDDKGRLMIPARWRKGIGREVYIAPSTEGGLFVMSKVQFDGLRARIAALDDPPEKKEDFKRHLEYNSELAALDGQGRINLNEAVLNRGGISTGVEVVLKLREYGIEVFTKQRWSQVQESKQPTYLELGRKAGI